MKAAILAAGEGTRMRPLSSTRPKPMLPVAGKPLLAHVMDAAAPHVDGFVVIVGYKRETITDHFGTEYADIPIEYVEQGEQLGTAHGFGQAEPHVDGRFLALNGDLLVTDGVIDAVASQGGPAMAVKEVSNPSEYGIVSVVDGRVTEIVEKPADPPSSLANLGVYAFPESIFECIESTSKSERGEYEITDSIACLIDSGHDITPVEYDGPWLDVGRPWELLEANAHLLADLSSDFQGTVDDRVTTEGPVVVEEGARVRDGSYLEGPIIVREGADVGPNAYVRGNTVLGEDVRVGNAVEIKNSILMRDASVGHQSYVGDSILGESVNFGAGTNVANLRHDDQPIGFRVKGEIVDTGRRKFGVVLGDGVKTGINTSLNAGISLPPGAFTLPGETVMESREAASEPSL